MATKIYGASDDLIECDGDVTGEVSAYKQPEEGVLLACSDGTFLGVGYGKPAGGIWEIKLFHAGPLFDRIEICTDEDAEIYSDVAYFKDGLKSVYASKEWERVT